MQGLPHHFNSMEGEKVVLFGIIISLFLWASGGGRQLKLCWNTTLTMVVFFFECNFEYCVS